MKTGKEEEVTRHLESETPDIGTGFSGTLRDLARLSELVAEDARVAVRCEGEQCDEMLREIERKTDLLHKWLIKKADQADQELPD